MVFRFALILCVSTCLAPVTAGASAARHAEAEGYYQRGVRLLEKNTIDTRRMAMRSLEQATLLEPTNATYQLTLARTYYRIGFLKDARRRFELVVKMNPGDADGHYSLGLVWRRDWLKYLDRTSLQRAIDNYWTAARLKPTACEAWLGLVPLLVEQRDLRSAGFAANQALDAEPWRPEALLAVGYTSYRLGNVERADSAFRVVYPRLPRNVRDKFDDISPVATEKDTMILNHLPSEQQTEFVRRFWLNTDPDLATPENEARLEYWSRVAQAYFLYYNAKLRQWDERGEVYVRYGPPQFTEYNPVNASLYGWRGAPTNLLVWHYLDLGMHVVMEDRFLSENYMLPITRDWDPDPRPNPAMVALKGDVATAEGRGVFPSLPPGVKPMPVDGAIAVFEAGGQKRLLTQVEAPGTPGDSLWAEWVVLDSTLKEVTRGRRVLEPSACDATQRRVADFATELPAGTYQIGLTVRDRQGHRGVYKSFAHVDGARHDLALSDIVVSCGSPSLAFDATEPAVRIEPNPAARVVGSDPLTAYFEIYHLALANDGQARFEYVYVVKSAERDPRIWLQRVLSPRKKPDPIEVSRQDENTGDLRRQFVTVPVQSLPEGHYQIEIRVRDLVAGSEVARSVRFVKVGVGG